MSRHPRIVAAIIGGCYIMLGWLFVASDTLDAWPSHKHWGVLLVMAGVSAWWYAWRPSKASVAVSGTLLVSAMALRFGVLVMEILFDPVFDNGRRDTAIAGATVALSNAVLTYVVWMRLLVPAQAWRAHR